MDEKQPIIAELVVESVDASIFWYRDLGFEVDGEGLRDDDGLQWVSMTRWAPVVLRADLSPDDARARRACGLSAGQNVDTIYER